MLRRQLSPLVRRARPSFRASALRINTHDRVRVLRIVAEIRQLGGIPSRYDPLLFVFNQIERRDLAVQTLRGKFGWTCVECDD